MRRPGIGVARRSGFRGIGGGPASAAPSGALLAWADGAFARASEASYLTAADALAWAVAHARREDAALFGETLTLIESARQNVALRSEELNTGWTATSATVTADNTTAPDGAADADAIAHTASANARVSQILNAVSLPNGTLITPSFWDKLKSGGGSHRLDIVQRDGTTSAPTLTDIVAGATWARRVRRAVDVGTGASNPQIRDRNGSGGAATDVYVWGVQVEVALYETSYIRTTTATVTRQADQATWLAAEVPLALRAAAATMRAAAWWSDADLAASDERWLLSFGGADDGLRVRNDAGTVKLEALAGGVVVASKTLSGLTRRAAADVAWDPVAGTVSYGGVAGSAGTPWTWPATSLRVGGIEGGASEWDGGVALPEAV